MLRMGRSKRACSEYLGEGSAESGASGNYLRGVDGAVDSVASVARI